MTTLSAAEQYARLKADRFEAFMEASFSEEALKDVQLYDVPTPSGQVFKCRKVDSAFVTNTGKLPMVLSQSLITQGKKVSKDEAAKRFAEMSETEQRAHMQATAAMVRYLCIEPRLVLGDVGNRQNAISVDMLTRDDFAAIVDWAEGGDAVSGLKTFRRKRK